MTKREFINQFSDDDLSCILFDSISPGWCRECGEESEPHEPDARDNYCPCCGANSVASVFVLLGVI